MAQTKKTQTSRALKITISIAACIFLSYKLYSFEQYDSIRAHFAELNCFDYGSILLTLALMLGNICTESKKWQILTQDIEFKTFKESIRSVIFGLTGAVISPNRLGEFPARSLEFQAENRISTIAAGGIGSLAQTIIIFACGIPASLLFLNQSQLLNTELTIITYVALLVLMLGTLLFLPKLTRKTSERKSLTFINETLKGLRKLNARTYLDLFKYALLRYLIFGTQLYFMLQFFGIELTIPQSLITIPTYYIFITCTPHVSFSEAIVRSSWGIIVFGIYSSNSVNITLAATLLWAINNLLPMLALPFLKTKCCKEIQEV